jgi:hypothetical protein
MAATDETPAAISMETIRTRLCAATFLFWPSRRNSGRSSSWLSSCSNCCTYHDGVIRRVATKKPADWTTRPKITSVSFRQVLPSVYGSSETHRHCNRLFEIAAIGDVHDAAFEHSAGRAMNMADSQRRRDADVQMCQRSSQVISRRLLSAPYQWTCKQPNAE